MNYPGLKTYQYVTKKYVYELLQEKYGDNENILERVSHYLATEQDVRDFVKMLVDCYDKGYTKAINDYKEKLKELGYAVQIVAEKSVK